MLEITDEGHRRERQRPTQHRRITGRTGEVDHGETGPALPDAELDFLLLAQIEEAARPRTFVDQPRPMRMRSAGRRRQTLLGNLCDLDSRARRTFGTQSVDDATLDRHAPVFDPASTSGTIDVGEEPRKPRTELVGAARETKL